MHKKVIVSFLLIALFLPSFKPSLQSTTVTTHLSADTNNVGMIGMDLQLKEPNSNTYYSVNSSLNAKVPDVLNSTNAIFLSSFINRDPTPIVLSWFQVNIYNSTETTIPDKTLTKTYNTADPTQEILIPANSSYSESFSSVIPFSLINENFQIQYQYQYAFQSNLSNGLTLNSPFNYTLHSALPPYSPPTFVIWLWWSINGLIAIQLLIGWYGNRKLKKRNLQH